MEGGRAIRPDRDGGTREAEVQEDTASQNGHPVEMANIFIETGTGIETRQKIKLGTKAGRLLNRLPPKCKTMTRRIERRESL